MFACTTDNQKMGIGYSIRDGNIHQCDQVIMKYQDIELSRIETIVQILHGHLDRSPYRHCQQLKRFRKISDNFT